MNAAPSPSDRPLGVLNGAQRSGASTRSERNAATTSGVSTSAPPARTASTLPLRSRWSARAIALADEAQAVDTARRGPVAPIASATAAAMPLIGVGRS
jgi:hypothetical protein